MLCRLPGGKERFSWDARLRPDYTKGNADRLTSHSDRLVERELERRFTASEHDISIPPGVLTNDRVAPASSMDVSFPSSNENNDSIEHGEGRYGPRTPNSSLCKHDSMLADLRQRGARIAASRSAFDGVARMERDAAKL